MTEFSKTMKLHIHPDDNTARLFRELTECYSEACSYISEYVFHHGFILNFMLLQEELYDEIRARFGLKSQMTISSFKTVAARYKTVREQLQRNPFKYQDEDDAHFELTKEDIHNLIVFMDRTNLTGGEVATFVSLYQKLQKLKEGAENGRGAYDMAEQTPND